MLPRKSVAFAFSALFMLGNACAQSNDETAGWINVYGTGLLAYDSESADRLEVTAGCDFQFSREHKPSGQLDVTSGSFKTSRVGVNVAGTGILIRGPVNSTRRNGPNGRVYASQNQEGVTLIKLNSPESAARLNNALTALMKGCGIARNPNMY